MLVYNVAQVIDCPGWEVIRFNSEETDQKKLYKDIKNTITQCNAAVFVVGNNNHNSPWIKKEADIVTSKRKPYFLLQLPNTNGAPPEKAKKGRKTSWDRLEVNAELRRIQQEL